MYHVASTCIMDVQYALHLCHLLRCAKHTQNNEEMITFPSNFRAGARGEKWLQAGRRTSTLSRCASVERRLREFYSCLVRA